MRQLTILLGLLLGLAWALVPVTAALSHESVAAADGADAIRPWAPECEGCAHRAMSEGCPDPGLCGYLPIRCIYCLDGVSMPNCPRPDWCGYLPVPPEAREVETAGSGQQELEQEMEEGWFGVQVLHDHAHDDCAMAMNFNTMEGGFCLLFKSWKVTSGGGFFLAILFVFSLSACREALDVCSSRLRRSVATVGGARRAAAGPSLQLSQSGELTPTSASSYGLLENEYGTSSSAAAGPAGDAIVTLKFHVRGMTCARCEQTISRALQQDASFRPVRVSFVSWGDGEVWVDCAVSDISATLAAVPEIAVSVGYEHVSVPNAPGSVASVRLSLLSGLDSRETIQQLAAALERVAGAPVEISVQHSEAWVPMGGADSKDLAVLLPALEDCVSDLGISLRVQASSAVGSGGTNQSVAAQSGGLSVPVLAALSFMHALLLLVAYVLMLVVMTYNVMLFITLIAGCALGHFASHSWLADPKKRFGANPTEADHCCQ